MKKLVLFIACVVIAVSASAQTETTGVIKGAVIDKNGNPLPGAMVQSTEGAETVIVDSDGTFMMEVPIWLKTATATYPGMKKSTKKVNFNELMVFSLKPKTDFAFVNLMFGYGLDIENNTSAPIIGIMGGYVDKWGGYVKLAFPLKGEDMGYGMQGILGALRQLSKVCYVYAGLGYGGAIYFDEYRGRGAWDPGMAFDLGMMFKVGKHFDLTAGLTITSNFEYAETNVMPAISLGYAW